MNSAHGALVLAVLSLLVAGITGNPLEAALSCAGIVVSVGLIRLREHFHA